MYLVYLLYFSFLFSIFYSISMHTCTIVREQEKIHTMLAFLQFLNPFDAACEVVHQQVQPKLRRSTKWIAAVVSILDGLRCCSQLPRVLNHWVSKDHRPMISNTNHKQTPQLPGSFSSFYKSFDWHLHSLVRARARHVDQRSASNRHFSLLITLQGQRMRPHAQRIIEAYQGVEAGNTFLTRLDETIRGEIVINH